VSTPVRSPAYSDIPPLIKRNTWLFALCQSFTGAGMSFAYGLGPLMVLALTSSATLSGLSVALLGLSRFLVAYPTGKITDAFGRRPGILLGLALGLAGTIAVGFSMTTHSIGLLIGGMLVFGMGMNASQQMRVAATDMYLPGMRAQALGFVALGSLAGLMVSPALIGGAEALAHRIGQDPLGLPWFLLPVLIVPGMLLVTLVRPDPKEIGMHLERYYPGYTPPPPPAAGKRPGFRAMSLLEHVPTRLAIVASCSAQGNMSIVMVLTSLVLNQHGHSLTAIAFSHMFHSAGMFAFTVPLGRLADRHGREPVMYWGVAGALVGAILVAFTGAFWSVTLGTFLVGLGWAAANVAATALIADYAETGVRGRAIGVNDSFAGAITVLTAVVTGPLIEWSGIPATGFLAIVLSLVPLVMVLGVRMNAWMNARMSARLRQRSRAKRTTRQ
jgi:MFS family permease